jgi:hypothetical protein
MKIAYGKTTSTSATDSSVIEIRDFVKTISAVVRPGAYLVDSIPWLKHIPWYGRDLRRGFERTKKLNLGQLNRVREQMVYFFFQNLDFMSESFHSRVT